MRWDGQRVAGEEEQLPGMPALKGLVRSVRTPEFAGVTFHEVRARSVLNRVPGGSPMPFSWTINPYRGCSHACTYCLAEDTPILLADGTSAPLRDVRVGDLVVGTDTDATGRRRLRATPVLDRWRTTKPAWRVRLADGTVLVASAEHRFLTERGWAHVRPEGCAADGERPHLRVGDRLVGAETLDASTFRRPGAGAAGAPCAAAGSPGATTDGRAVVAVEAEAGERALADLTTGTGDFVADGVVSHNCFARNTHTYLDLDAGEDFDRQVVVKLNAPEVVARELRSPRWAREHVAMGTNTDPYQRAEGRYGLMPGIVRALGASGTPFSILTKGTLLARDLPELSAIVRDTPVGVGVSLALLDPDLHRSVEPGTPTPRARLDLVRRVRDAGLPCGVFVAPVLPGLTDSDERLDALLGEIAAAGATGASVLALHLRPGTREWFHGWLQREHPHLLERYAALYRRGAYVDAAYRRDLAARVTPLLRRHGLGGDEAERSSTVGAGGGHAMSGEVSGRLAGRRPPAEHPPAEHPAALEGIDGREAKGQWPHGAMPPPSVPAAMVTETPGEQLSLM